MSTAPLNYYDVDDYTATKRGQVEASQEKGKVYKYTFDVTDGPVATDTDTAVQTIPAGAVIKAADIQVVSTLSGGTNFTLGMSQPDGTVIDADGIDAAVTATSGYVSADGALIGTALSAEGQLTFTGTRTAGVLEVTIYTV